MDGHVNQKSRKSVRWFASYTHTKVVLPTGIYIYKSHANNYNYAARARACACKYIRRKTFAFVQTKMMTLIFLEPKTCSIIQRLQRIQKCFNRTTTSRLIIPEVKQLPFYRYREEDCRWQFGFKNRNDNVFGLQC